MDNYLKNENRRKHINKLAQEFMCAILSDGRWWEVHPATPSDTVKEAFVFAEAFCKEEEMRKEKK